MAAKVFFFNLILALSHDLYIYAGYRLDAWPRPPSSVGRGYYHFSNHVTKICFSKNWLLQEVWWRPQTGHGSLWSCSSLSVHKDKMPENFTPFNVWFKCFQTGPKSVITFFRSFLQTLKDLSLYSGPACTAAYCCVHRSPRPPPQELQSWLVFGYMVQRFKTSIFAKWWFSTVTDYWEKYY